MDRYCINQDEKEEVGQQIAQMDRIYRGADFTIIASSDGNGLAGVSTKTRHPKLRVFNFSDSIVLYETDPNPLSEVHRSPSFARGWTFQEAVLSRRCLFFTSTQAFFECTTGTWCEMSDLKHKLTLTEPEISAWRLRAQVHESIPNFTQLISSGPETNRLERLTESNLP